MDNRTVKPCSCAGVVKHPTLAYAIPALSPNPHPTPMIGSIIAWIVLGALAGFLARAILPGSQNYSLPLTIVLGIIGAIVGGFLADALGLGDAGARDGAINLWSILTAALGAILVVFIYSKVAGGTRARV